MEGLYLATNVFINRCTYFCGNSDFSHRRRLIIINSTSTYSGYAKIRVGMKTYFDDKIKNLYVPNRSAFISGRYQGSCSPPDEKSYQGLNEQGVHHVAMGWVGKKITFYVDTCVESSGSAISKIFEINL